MKAVNEIVGREGLVLTILVFGAFPCLGFDRDKQYPSNAVRTLALQKARDALTIVFSRCQVSSAIGTWHGPDTADARASPLG